MENSVAHIWTTAEQRIKSPEWIQFKIHRTKVCQEWFAKHQTDHGDATTFLQVGPGADGEVFFWQKGKRYCIDPLANFFKKKYAVIIDPTVEFTEGKGEQLPYPDDFFDQILCTNVLDHTDNDKEVLREMHRVLKGHGRGLLILEVHVFSWLGHLVRLVIKDVGHPYNYLPKMLTKKVLDAGFQIVETRHDQRGSRYAKKTDPLKTKLWRAFADRVWQKRYYRYLLRK